jgi:acid phosphatase
MYIYSCHDSTLVGLLGLLDVYDFKWPPFGSYVIFETYENKEQQKFVRVSYNGKVGGIIC